ncbi:MAG: S8 family serine peptidase [Deltaproteobacteria bacterium]|nr:S8 family serine peptidase [Deltaproteobacteria bacterium]
MHLAARTLLALAALAVAPVAAAASPSTSIGINVLLRTEPTAALLADLGAHGKVRDVVAELRAVTLQARAGELAAIAALPYVLSATPDAARNGGPVDTVAAADFSGGISTWDQDAIDATDFGAGRVAAYDGSGVYVAVLDTGLLDSWRQYFPQERIATQYALALGGGGGENGNVSTPTNKWEHDQNSHGTHVTSTILGYSLRGTPVNGTAPLATVIPVKVLNQNGSGWSSVVARGITYVANLKKGPLADSPVVINMSLGGPSLDAMEKAAIDYAIEAGVLIVASAGNEGTAGMGYPGAYAPVISVAASGWVGEWSRLASGAVNGGWWNNRDVADPTSSDDFYIADFSSRALAGQDLDVAAPGSWVVGPYQTNSGQTSYFFLGGTSMASPHVAGIVALMAQRSPGLTQAQAEGYLVSAALPLPAGCRMVNDPRGVAGQVCWGDDATGAGLITVGRALAAMP